MHGTAEGFLLIYVNVGSREPIILVHQDRECRGLPSGL